MCGIAGLIRPIDINDDSLDKVVGCMADAIQYRGPDDAGTWADVQSGIALGHRRLAIVDLSAAGHQPMHSDRGRYVMVFNGEVYNHMVLRAELEAMDCRASLAMTEPGDGLPPDARTNGGWRGHSDTETLLAGFEAWGIEATLKKAVGMFAIALWDTQDKTLHLARDRFGEKPLYYGWVGQGADRAFVFGSELKALRAYPGFDNAVCREALAQYMRYMYVPAPLSIYQGIYKLEPGCLLSVTGLPRRCAPRNDATSANSHDGPTANGHDGASELTCAPGDESAVHIRRWWSMADAVQAGLQNPINDEAEAIAALETQLQEAVRLQSLADVPLGAFLSGGVDSSLIVALMQQQAKKDGAGPVKTFTVGFEEAGFDESPHAKAVAQHLGTEHSELFVTAAQAQAVIPLLPQMYDEPFADSSQIPTHLVCRAARQQVTVALSGDAGDELFGGYNRYFWGPRIWSRLAWMPYAVRRLLGWGIAAVPVKAWDALAKPINALLPGAKGIARVGDKAHKLAVRLRNVRSMDDLYVSLVTEWQDPGAVVKRDAGGTGLPRSARNDDASGLPCFARKDDVGGLPRDSRNDDIAGLGDAERMMFKDSITYLPDDILCKVDRAAMATSLETRVPFLDHRVAELAWRLPMRMKIRGNEGKWALRQVLYKHVPRELIERPKAGFSIPVGVWLRGPLRLWAEELLDAERLEREGYLHTATVQKLWQEHLSGRFDWTAKLWSVLMFQAWLKENA
jgi:asparagine synthase (glutamine-hydrolysing)